MRMTSRIIARFPGVEELDAALSDLRRCGAVVHTGSLLWLGAAPPTLHLTVRPVDACMARAIVRRAGGTLTS